MTNVTYILSVWEAVELLHEILKKHLPEKGRKEVVQTLNKSQDYIELSSYFKLSISGELAKEFRKYQRQRVGADEKKQAPVVEKAGEGDYAKLFYNISLNVKKGVPSYLSYEQLNVLLAYLGKESDIDKYDERSPFDPDFTFRKKFKESTWVLYTWDYNFDTEGNKVPGIRSSILSFTNLFRTNLNAFRVREDTHIQYNGMFHMVKDEYLKIRFNSSNSNLRNEEDLSFIFYIGSNNDVSLAVGNYRSIDCGSLLSGSAIIQRVANDENFQANFISNFSESTIDPLIRKYLEDKAMNYNKLPEKITSLNTLREWTIKNRKKSY